MRAMRVMRFEPVGGQKALMTTVEACAIASEQTQAVWTSPEAGKRAHTLTLVHILSPVNLDPISHDLPQFRLNLMGRSWEIESRFTGDRIWTKVSIGASFPA